MSGRKLLVLLLAVAFNDLLMADAQKKPMYLGDDCALDGGGTGTCKRTTKCPHAQELISAGGHPKVCINDRRDPVVCCPKVRVPPAPVTKRPKPLPTTKRPEVKPKPKPAPLVEPVMRGKSWEKCQLYGEEVYREVEIPTLTFEPEKVKEADCAMAAQQLIIGGKKVEPKEFPHMASLGFGDDPNIAWLCGGSLISDKFVLTAGHCLFAKGRGKVKWVQLGDLNLQSTTDDSRPQRLQVQEAIAHPGYKPPSHYHDIALLRLKTSVVFDAFVRPACLNTGAATPAGANATATGWGVTNWANEELSTDLMKVDLRFHPAQRCNETFRSLITSSNKLLRGFTEDTMICAGDPENKRDTCVGDSGGPLQLSLTKPYCMYTIVGVTSFGSRACGESNSPAVYSRVSYYVPWIEGVVWP